MSSRPSFDAGRTQLVQSPPSFRSRAEGVLRILERVLDLLPRGERLPEKVWLRRHRFLVYLLWFHAVGLAVFGTIRGYGALHSALETSVLIVAALISNSPRLSRRVRSGTATIGTLLSSAFLVHFAGGAIEAHFHYFVMLGVVSLYQDWSPFLVAVAFVAISHGMLGALSPHAVYNHQAAINDPWTWAGVHAMFVAGNCLVLMVYWRASEERAMRDSLTNLVNGTLFMDRLQQALAREHRYGRLVGVLFIDLDGFKAVNDRLGHAAGDRVLVEVARRIQLCLRSADTAGRLGGDEFGVILEELTEPGDAVVVAQRLLTALQEPFPLDGSRARISASIGVATNDIEDLAESLSAGRSERVADRLVQGADAAMLLAKNAGRSRIQVFDPTVQASHLKRMELERELEPAIARNEFVLQYQPVISLGAGEVIGLEALVRWQHPTRGLLPPSEFIPLAERTGAIVPLGRWVLNEACGRVRGWQVEHQAPLRLFVNVSGRQLERGILLQDLQHATDGSGLTPQDVVVELTESIMVHDPDSVLATVDRLKEVGAKLAVDDFGTGYSSLNYLRSLPVDILKVDRGFIHGLSQGTLDARFALAIIRLATSLGLTTVAEGVESEAEWKELAPLGFDWAQGFHIAKPLNPEEVGSFLVNDHLARVVQEGSFGPEDARSGQSSGKHARGS